MKFLIATSFMSAGVWLVHTMGAVYEGRAGLTLFAACMLFLTGAIGAWMMADLEKKRQ